MRPLPNLLGQTLLLCLLILLSGCQDRSISALLWPEQHDPFFQLTRDWSRTGVVRDSLESQTRVVALLKSESWRRAYVQRYAEVFGLTAEESEKMLADQLRAMATETAFILAVSSTYPENARLTHRLTQWRVLLLDSLDQTIQPLEIRPMDVHPAEMQAFYPHHHPWQYYFTVRFPKREVPLDLLFTGPSGRFILRWEQSD